MSGDETVKQSLQPITPADLGLTERQEGRLLAGRYLLVAKLGEGGMGSVWRADQIEPVKRPVAVKLIRLGLASQHGLARFEAERQALALMDHPHIATVLDGGVAEGEPFYVMELVEGQPLNTYCTHHRVLLHRRLQLFVDICRAVQHAHQKGIIHRDLKPANILVVEQDRKPVPKIIDFGIAKATLGKLTEETVRTEAGQLIGTLEYMSPEQAGGTGLDLDTRSDIYALGVILYELITGEVPFSRRELKQHGLAELLRRIRETEPVIPSKRARSSSALAAPTTKPNLEWVAQTPDMPPELDWITMKCLEKDRARRYDTAAALADDVERYLHDEPVLAAPPSASYRLGKFLTRHRRAVVAAGLVMLALTLGIVASTLALFRALNAEEKQRQALLQAQNAATKSQAAAAAARESERGTLRMLDFINLQIVRRAQPEGYPGALGRDVPLRVALDAAVGEIAAFFADQPALEVRLRLSMGGNYMILGEMEKARAQFEAALATADKHLNPGDDATIAATERLGAFWSEVGQPQRAEPYSRRALEQRLTRWPDNDRLVVITKASLAHTLLGLDKPEEAGALIEQGLRACDENAAVGVDVRQYLNILRASVLEKTGQLEESVRLLRELLAEIPVTAAHTGDYHLRDLTHRLAVRLHNMEQYDEADPLYQRAEELFRQALGDQHPLRLLAGANRASLLMDMGALDRAGPQIDALVALCREAPSIERYFLGAMLCTQSWHRLETGHGAEAERLAEEAAGLIAMSLGRKHWLYANARAVQGAALARAGKLEEAEPLLKESAETMVAVRDAPRQRRRWVVDQLISLYEAGGKPEAAAPWRDRREGK
ncbi:MAG TPA: serine/threonine-protein kinase [Gemmatales bacterium]|nr:serine/threonine-protein kinase [Gemmatales bacterium]HMP59581.1 serine/threonine-protein kinase [Gemmatales bacterium]